MNIDQVADAVADKLHVSSESVPDGPAPRVMGPELSPGRAITSNKTVDEVVAELQKSPFFMTELDTEENDDLEALRALSYEGTPLENASDFKERGNETFRVKHWTDAKEFYSKGILILVAEERKRAGKWTPPPKEEKGKEKETVTEDDKKVEDTPEEIAKQKTLLEALYGNRAACNLELKNYRSCWLDGAAALRLNPRNVKAYYRSAKALLAVGRIEEADDACARGLELDENNASLKAVARDIIKKHEEAVAKKRKEDEAAGREKRRQMLLTAALRARGIRTRATAQPPEMEDAKVQLVPDPDDPTSSLSFPAVLLYPEDLESDFIKAFNEQESLADHLSYVFPLPWDQKREYTLAGVECYMDTVSGGLIKVGKKAPLLKALSSDKVEVVDDVVRIYVLPKAKADNWVQEFKRKKAAEKGG
ncbi:hypothetical protein BX600DRAFT_446386 [Xylariales sp. PMI_506]|nr:hypothetical protein BX600DRAFT_446386 [Xylariales sp. PMI_506]